MEQGSPFLAVPQSEWVASNDLAFAIRDRFPVSPGHTLVVTRRLVPDWWAATASERSAVSALVDAVKAGLEATSPAPDGFNVGFNSGMAAGQTIDHLHVHVIPRFSGDVGDPRGGIRHVIPGRGNYLDDPLGVGAIDPALDRFPPAVSSAVEAVTQVAVDEAGIIQWLLTLIDSGLRSATYKPALLMAITEIASESDVGAEALPIPVADLAERVMALYWPSTRPYDGGVLSQVKGGRSRIMGALERLHASGTPGATSLDLVRQRRPEEYRHARDTVARALALQPIPRLQRPGSVGVGPGLATSYPRYLYDDSRFIAERGALDKDPVVMLRPGIARALARNAPVLRTAIQEVWTREVASINRVHTGYTQLRDFLFGADRTALGRVRAGLRDLGIDRCFWCDERLGGDASVDHVVPWSQHPNDDLFNLVLVDARCNSSKSSRLASPRILDRWLDRGTDELSDLAAQLARPVGRERAIRIARAAYLWLPSDLPVWDVGRLVPYDSDLRAVAQRMLVA